MHGNAGIGDRYRQQSALGVRNPTTARCSISISPTPKLIGTTISDYVLEAAAHVVHDNRVFAELAAPQCRDSTESWCVVTLCRGTAEHELLASSGNCHRAARAFEPLDRVPHRRLRVARLRNVDEQLGIFHLQPDQPCTGDGVSASSAVGGAVEDVRNSVFVASPPEDSRRSVPRRGQPDEHLAVVLTEREQSPRGWRRRHLKRRAERSARPRTREARS